MIGLHKLRRNAFLKGILEERQERENLWLSNYFRTLKTSRMQHPFQENVEQEETKLSLRPEKMRITETRRP